LMRRNKGSWLEESQVRTGLFPGGRWIRTSGPSQKDTTAFETIPIGLGSAA
jgi:hypothetical protein